MEIIELLEELKKYNIEYGIFSEDGLKKISVNLINPDKTESTVDMTIGDLMYFTEYGTITLPGQFIFEKTFGYINHLLDKTISDIIDKIFEEKIISPDGIMNNLKPLELKIENYIKSLMNTLIKTNNVLNSIINKENAEIKDIYNLKKLSDYIKCRIFRNI